MQPELIVHKLDINGDVAVKCSNSLHICGDCSRYVTPVFDDFLLIFQDFFQVYIELPGVCSYSLTIYCYVQHSYQSKTLWNLQHETGYNFMQETQAISGHTPSVYH